MPSGRRLPADQRGVLSRGAGDQGGRDGGSREVRGVHHRLQDQVHAS